MYDVMRITFAVLCLLLAVLLIILLLISPRIKKLSDFICGFRFEILQLVLILVVLSTIIITV